jgi:hypothetical protein
MIQRFGHPKSFRRSSAHTSVLASLTCIPHVLQLQEWACLLLLGSSLTLASSGAWLGKQWQESNLRLHGLILELLELEPLAPSCAAVLVRAWTGELGCSKTKSKRTWHTRLPLTHVHSPLGFWKRFSCASSFYVYSPAGNLQLVSKSAPLFLSWAQLQSKSWGEPLRQ